MQHEVLAARGGDHGGELRGVRAGGAEQLLRADARVDFVRTHRLHAVRERAAAADQVADDRTRAKILETLVEIVPHDELAEVEASEPERIEDLPALQVADRLAEDADHGGDVEPGVVLGRRIELGDGAAEFAAQHLEQRHVDDGVLVRARERIAGAGRLAVEADGHEHERRLVGGGPGAGSVEPAQEPHADEEGVDAAVLDVGPGLTVQAGQTPVELLFLEHRAEAVAGEFAFEVLPDRIFASLPLERRGVPGIAFCGVEDLRPRIQRELGTVVERVLERVRAWNDDLDRLLRIAEVEEAVAAREVEELRAPAHDAGGDVAGIRVASVLRRRLSEVAQRFV